MPGYRHRTETLKHDSFDESDCSLGCLSLGFGDRRVLEKRELKIAPIVLGFGLNTKSHMANSMCEIEKTSYQGTVKGTLIGALTGRCLSSEETS